MASNLLVSSLCLLLALFLVCQVQAQFFTKSSKSIPRMGRRSDESFEKSSHSRGALIGNLLDEFGALNVLRAIQANLLDSSQSRETALNKLRAQPEGRKLPESKQFPVAPKFARNNEQNSESLAMRALNIQRYLQHLASGQPLEPLERVVSSGRQAEREKDQDPAGRKEEPARAGELDGRR